MIAFRENLNQILSEPTCIVGVGNLFRNDDAVGVMIAQRLETEFTDSSQFSVVNAEDVIENFVFQIADKDVKNVLVIDGVQADGAETGALVLGKMEDIEIKTMGYSTHKLALSTAASVLKHHGKEVYLLGIVTDNTDYGTTVSQSILESAEGVIDLVRATARSH